MEGQERDKNDPEVKRIQRSDKGRVLLTPRDLVTLPWIAEQYTARLDQIGRLLGREAQRTTQQAGVVQITTANRVLRRWLAAGLVKSKYVMAREPPWVYLTTRGLHELGLPYRVYTPTAVMINHHYWTNQVRLWVEHEYPTDRWISERTLLKQREGTDEKSRHLVDGEIQRFDEDGDETVIAVEVELTVKAAQRSQAIMEELAEAYDGIWYFTNAASHDAVCRTINTLSKEVRQRFRVRDLTLTL
jgi:hypothetical protein